MTGQDEQQPGQEQVRSGDRDRGSRQDQTVNYTAQDSRHRTVNRYREQRTGTDEQETGTGPEGYSQDIMLYTAEQDQRP